MAQEKTVLRIVEDYLRTHGYNGLWNEEDCGCPLDNLAPCDNMASDCKPGYKLACDCGDHDQHIGPRQSEVRDDDRLLAV